MGDKENDAVSETIAGTLGSPPSLPTLSFDLIPEILSRLPVKLLLQLKCVCKSWNSLISDPKFAKKHLHLSTTRLVHTLTFPDLSGRYVLKSYTLDSVLTNRTAIVAHPEFNYRVDFVGSCNGILCLLFKDYADFGTVGLWNPSIRKFNKLPSFKKRLTFDMYGFGYDPVSDNYKVVVVSRVFDSSSHLVAKTDVNVHTLGTNIWRNIPEFPFVCIALQKSGIYVSGTINWLVKGHWLLKGCAEKNIFFVVSLELRSESYQEVLLPDYGKVGQHDLHLSVLRDCLCMICGHDVWVMKEYGNKESWTKLLTVSCMQDPRTSWLFTDVMQIFEVSQVFLKSGGDNRGKLVFYNSISGSFEYPFPFENTLSVCVESLISPFS